MPDLQNSHHQLQLKHTIKLENSNTKRRLPSIPDSRNKYGIIDTQQSMVDYIHKSEEDLRREKEIMKCYRSTLLEHQSPTKSPKASVQKQKLLSSPSEVLKMIKSLKLEDSHSEENQKKKHGPSRKVMLKPIKQKFGNNKHLSTNQKIQRYRLGQKQHEFDRRQEKAQKFQFFNSSEHRFKETVQKENKEKSTKTVAEYLQMMKKDKLKGGEQIGKNNS